MRCSKLCFERFANRHGTVYPWNRIKKTRNSFYCRWIITTGPTTSLFDRSIHHIVGTSTLPNGYVTSLIVEKVAIPVPPELDDIIDTMDYWGVRVSGLWKLKVIHVLVKKLKSGEETSRKSMCFSFIAMLLHELLGVAVNSREFDDMMFAYCIYCRSIYSNNVHFFQLAVKCKSWFERNYYINTAPSVEATNVVTPERSSSLSTGSVSTRDDEY